MSSVLNMPPAENVQPSDDDLALADLLFAVMARQLPS